MDSFLYREQIQELLKSFILFGLKSHPLGPHDFLTIPIYNIAIVECIGLVVSHRIVSKPLPVPQV